MTPDQGNERDRIRGELLEQLTPKMMPGQTPYTPEELDALHRMIADAAAGDPGEAGENL